MNPIVFSIRKPVAVSVGVLLLVFFGLLGLGAIPVQLTPTVDYPIINVTTVWPGRSPQEIVDEIVTEQEERLKNVTNLKAMRSTSMEGTCTITLEFTLGADIAQARQEVSDALRQVPEYPDEVDEPIITVAGTTGPDSAIAWMIIDLDPSVKDQFPDFDITTLLDPLDKEVKPYLERIDGVAEVNIYGGRERELRVLVDPVALAQRSLTYDQLIRAIRAENRNISAGSISEGKREIRVRVLGQFENPEQVLDTPVAARNGRVILLRDVATVELGYEKRTGFIRSFGEPALAMNLIRQSGANVVDIMRELRARLDEVRSEILPTLHPAAGPHLRLRQLYDETTYIDSAIRLVTQNLWIGGSIAALVLLLFLRSIVSTFVIAIAIPVSVIATFLVLLAFGRTLNVISLAGLAFAVGMVVDNAIVVLESIYKRIEKGEEARHAALGGAREVWGAILASTLTTVAVFIPILTIQEEAGQLFRDLSLAIVASVLLSLLISVTVIPSACSRWLRTHRSEAPSLLRAVRSLFGLVPLLGRLTNAVASFVAWSSTSWRGWSIRPLVIAFLTAASLGAAAMLVPPLDYLPAGNRNLVFGGLAIPPGYSVEQMEDIARRIEARLKPYAEADLNSVANLPPIPRFDFADPTAQLPPFDPVPIENLFIGAFGGGLFVGATSKVEQTVIPIGTLVTNAMMGIPDAFGGASQASIFGRDITGGNTINIEISGPRLDRVADAASFIYARAGARYGFGSNVNAEPSNFNLPQQEWRIRLNDNARRLGITTQAVGVAARALFDGAFVDDYRYDQDTIDLVLLPEGGRLPFKESVASIPVTTPAGGTVSLASIVDFTPALAPQQIQRIEELPSVTIKVKPPDQRPVGALMDEIQRDIVDQARAAGLIDRTMRVRLEGTAAKLSEVTRALVGTAPERSGRSWLPASLAPWQQSMLWLSGAVVALGTLIAGFITFRATRRREGRMLYASAGMILFALVVALVPAVLATNPQLATARLVWALLVTYLLMAALFESFLYPLVIMFSVPLAVVGGFLGLRIVHDISAADPTKPIQQLDVLTMIGFIILIGVVVNNAILLVDRALSAMRDAENPAPIHEAVADAVRARVRPIFMSVLTSVAGMLPLVVMPGAGSEMYRGLGSVVVGGLLVSTVFTLVLVPMLLSLTLEMRQQLVRALARRIDG